MESLKSKRTLVIPDDLKLRSKTDIAGTLDPQKKFLIVWEYIAVVFAVYQLIMTPVEIGFSTGFQPHWICHDIITAFFIGDIILNFKTDFYKGIKYDPKKKKVEPKFFVGHLIIDLLATFPYRWIAALSGEPHPYSYPNLLQLFRLFELLRFFRLKRSVDKFYRYYELKGANLDFVFLFFCWVLFVHIVACFWWFIGSYEIYHNEPNSWIIENGFQDDSVSRAYAESFYWAITAMSTVGFGDITPVSTAERIFTSVIVILTPAIYVVAISFLQIIIEMGRKEEWHYQNVVLPRVQFPT